MKSYNLTNEGREGYIGWAGLGGSVFQWHTELKIGFGYVPWEFNLLDLYNLKGKWLQAEVKKCVLELYESPNY
jgi:hypothetical protein